MEKIFMPLFIYGAGAILVGFGGITLLMAKFKKYDAGDKNADMNKRSEWIIGFLLLVVGVVICIAQPEIAESILHM